MKKQKIKFIGITIFYMILLIFSLLFIVQLILVNSYPDKNELKYEQYTYVNHEYVSMGKGYYEYHIYVEEHDEPLKIDRSVEDKINEELLLLLKKGDVITVCVYDKKDLDLFLLMYNDADILSYNDYLSEHKRNNNAGIVMFSLISLVCIIYLIKGSIYYKKTGECFIR